jgi:hypothetical protein
MVLTAFFMTAAVSAQGILYQPDEDSPIGVRNPAGPAKLAEYDFLAGDWDVTVTMPQGDRPPLVYQARWHNHWVADGLVMMQEFRDPYATGVELRSLDPATGKWQGRNLYVPSPGRWYENEAVWTGDEMVVTTHRTTPDGRPLISREIYHAITANSFSIRTEESLDDGASWKPGSYGLVSKRAR